MRAEARCGLEPGPDGGQVSKGQESANKAIPARGQDPATPDQVKIRLCKSKPTLASPILVSLYQPVSRPGQSLPSPTMVRVPFSMYSSMATLWQLFNVPT